MENKMQPEAVEKQLTDQLSKAGFDKAQLSETSAKIALFQKIGARIIDWSVFGKPRIDRYIIEAHLDADRFAGLQTILSEKSLKEFVILRRGIPPVQPFMALKATFDNNLIVK